MSQASKTVLIVNKRGLHARASAKLVTLASSQPVSLTVEKDGRETTARLSAAALGPWNDRGWPMEPEGWVDAREHATDAVGE